MALFRWAVRGVTAALLLAAMALGLAYYFAARSLIATRSIARLLEEEHRACFWLTIRLAMQSC